MAEQTALDYEAREWGNLEAGGTELNAAALQKMDDGIAVASKAVDDLRTKRLPTYVVLSGGDTATTDAYTEPILGPCLILDLATRTTYYETGGDEEGHRKAIVSGADVDDLRDSLSQVNYGSLYAEDLDTVTSLISWANASTLHTPEERPNFGLCLTFIVETSDGETWKHQIFLPNWSPLAMLHRVKPGASSWTSWQ